MHSTVGVAVSVRPYGTEYTMPAETRDFTNIDTHRVIHKTYTITYHRCLTEGHGEWLEAAAVAAGWFR